ncbi:MAG: hypothetical protein ACOYLN_08710 [Blastocatellia bacterium]|jgi:hypothetical protein
MIERYLMAALLPFLICLFAASHGAAQTIPNRGLTAVDLETARALTLEVGGATAELVYANRFDVVARGEFDSLLVVYTKPGDQAGSYYAFIERNGQRLILAPDTDGRLLPRGDSFRRVGLQRRPSGSAVLRIISAFTDPANGVSRRNLDFQFNGTDFALIAQSTAIGAP